MADTPEKPAWKLMVPFSRRPSSSENPIASAQSLARVLAFTCAALAALNIVQFQDRAALLEKRVPIYPMPIAVNDTRTVAFSIPPMPDGVDRTDVLATAKAVEYVQAWYGYVPDQAEQSKFWEQGGWIDARSCTDTWEQFKSYRDGVRAKDNGTIGLKQEVRDIVLRESRAGQRVFDAQVVLMNAKTKEVRQTTNLRISLNYDWKPTTATLADLQRGLLPPNPEGFYACNFVAKARV